jgi:hydroxymethylbilane synthase
MIHNSKTLRLGTRGSPLALVQANLVRDALLFQHPDLKIEIVTIVSTGDRVQDRALAEIGGKALWTKELDQQLLSKDIDFAVHSMKDVETVRPVEICIAAMLERADVRDVLIGADSIESLPVGAIVGTSAPRRTAQLLRLRPDLKIILFRGNVDTRLRKVAEGEAQATLLAKAGLDRLGKAGVGVPIPINVMLPAPSQGAVGIETRADDEPMRALLASINHVETFNCVMAERALLKALNAGCQSPVAAHASFLGNCMTMQAEILSLDGAFRQHGAYEAGASGGHEPQDLALALLKEAPPALRALFG